MATVVSTASTVRVSDAYRWMQLSIGVACMVMIANLQYGWTFFVPDIQKTFGWDRAAIQWAFTLFVLFETWLVPIEGWFVDRYGPRVVVFVGGVLCAIGWVMNSYATSLNQYYLAQVIAGIGAGGVYGTCVGNALKWFPDKRGLAAGITAAGFGAGSTLTVAPIQAMIQGSGFQATFFNFGIGQGVIIMILSFLLVSPKAGQVPLPTRNDKVMQTRRDYTPTEIVGPSRHWLGYAIAVTAVAALLWAAGLSAWLPLFFIAAVVGAAALPLLYGQPVFLLMYFMFVIVGAGGLMVTANLAPIAKDFRIDAVPVTVMWLTMPALTFAASIDRFLNGLTRPFFGWVSDQIGRENTMFVAFALEGVGIYLLYLFGSSPFWFVILTGFVFFAWGEIYSLFPSTCTDTFGAKFAATNAGLLYTAKGTAALLIPFANEIQKATGSWDRVFLIAAAANILASILAIAVLKPWRASVIRRGLASS